MTRDELKALLDDHLPAGTSPTICLATCDARGPHVRPLSLVRDGLDLYFATSRRSEKIHHLDSHHEVEFVCLLERVGEIGCLRVAGTVIEVTGAPLQEAWVRAHGYDAGLHFRRGLDDPDLIAFRIQPTLVRLRLPGQREREIQAVLFASSDAPSSA